MSYIVQVTLYRFLFFGIMGRGQCCFAMFDSIRPNHQDEKSPLPCVVGYPATCRSLLRPPKASHSSSRTTSGDTRRIEINAASVSGSSFLRLSKFQNSYISFSFIFLLHLHGINYLLYRAFSRRSCHISYVTNAITRIFSGRQVINPAILVDNGRFDSK